jgi:acyl-coenzyme A thioesterase PaaI-like protein
MAFADHGLSFLAWEAAERAPCATIQMNSQFVGGVTPGEFVELRGEVVRRTSGLVFVRGMMVALGGSAEREVFAVDGIWRILRR